MKKSMKIINKYIVEQKELGIPKRVLGKTGYEVGILSLGGQGSLENQGNRDNNLQIIQEAYRMGINYFDTSPVYGPSEEFYGEVIPPFRKNIFLATKSDDRTRDGSIKLLEKSLKRLKTDYIDLWQVHHIDSDKDVDLILQKDGALKAFSEMKEQGVVKFIGLTGHAHPDLLLKLMKEFHFDTVLCPVNSADANMKPSFLDTVVVEANKQNMGIIGMKVFAQGFIFHPDGIVNPSDPLMFSMSQPISTIIVGHDSISQLRENVSIAKTFEYLYKEEIEEIKNKSKNFTKRGAFFRREFGNYQSREKLGKPFLPLSRFDK